MISAFALITKVVVDSKTIRCSPVTAVTTGCDNVIFIPSTATTMVLAGKDALIIVCPTVGAKLASPNIVCISPKTRPFTH